MQGRRLGRLRLLLLVLGKGGLVQRLGMWMWKPSCCLVLDGNPLANSIDVVLSNMGLCGHTVMTAPAPDADAEVQRLFLATGYR